MAGFIWPLGASTVPDEMNTSYGPRIDADRWDFHDGIDLPASVGTAVHAIADGVVYRAGPADKTDDEGYGSTHVVLRVVDPADGQNDLFILYLHLDSIDEGVLRGAHVSQGDVIALVGHEDAEYSHLHFEFRKGGAQEDRSVHPLLYLPYTNTSNVGELRLGRCNFYDDDVKRAVRLDFTVHDRREGDVHGVRVTLKGNNVPDREFRVNFADRQTIESDKGDGKAFKNGIAVEGYQKSDLKGDGFPDLRYGVIIKDIAGGYSSVALRVRDVRNEHPKSAVFALPVLEPGHTPVDTRTGFEGRTFPPLDWHVSVVPGNACRPDQVAARKGVRGLLCEDAESAQVTPSRAALRFDLPPARMSWRLTAEIRAAELGMGRGRAIYPLTFFSGDDLVAAACLRRLTDHKYVAGVLIRNAAGLFRERIDMTEGVITTGEWRRWELDLLRLGTRQTTAVVRLDGNVVTRLTGDTTTREPDRVHAGIVHRDSGFRITLHIDRLALTEALR